jgi:hypothetical protein
MTTRSRQEELPLPFGGNDEEISVGGYSSRFGCGCVQFSGGGTEL